MSFTFRDVFYILIIFLLVYSFNRSLKKEQVRCATSVENMHIQSRMAEAELLKRNKINLAIIDSLDRHIAKMNVKKEEILNKNKKLEQEIKNFKLDYEKMLLYIDTASVNEVIRYWTDEFEFRRQYKGEVIHN